MSILNNSDGYLKNKSLIMDGKFSVQHVNALSKAFSKKNEENTFRMSLKPGFDIESGSEKMILSFELKIPLPNDLCANFIENAFSDKKTKFPFPIELSVQRDDENKPYLSLTPEGDYTRSFRRPALAVGAHLEMYVKYNAFKMFANKMAEHRIYNFSPKKEGEPELSLKILNRENSKLKNFGEIFKKLSPKDKIAESRRVFVPRHKAIDEFFNINLTEEDYQDLSINFSKAADELRKISSGNPYAPKKDSVVHKKENSISLGKIK